MPEQTVALAVPKSTYDAYASYLLGGLEQTPADGPTIDAFILAILARALGLDPLLEAAFDEVEAPE